MGVIRGFVLCLALLAASVVAGAWYGVFDISARVPHYDIVSGLIEVVRDRSITVHSRGGALPALEDAALAAKGAPFYRESCRPCHGAPGMPSEVFAQGLYPGPSDLLSGYIQKKWMDHQLCWIVDNGLKMTGMPAFGSAYNQDELAGIVAFVKRLPGISPQEFPSMSGGAADAGVRY
ncbi:MAG: cytochrome c [Desulfobacteraceae bacterium]|nr:cytochrome c [Desulfobacteraceae bacterium]